MKKKIIAILIAVAVVAGGIMTVPLLADSATGSITHVQITPASVTLVTGTTQQYTAQALDSSNQPVSTRNTGEPWIGSLMIRISDPSLVTAT